MEKYFALIKNNIVHSIIIADEKFIQLIQKEHDDIIEVTDINRPHPGDSYYSKTNTFVANHTEMIDIPSSEPEPTLTFSPFQLSKYTVSHDNGYIVIGCKKYSAAGFIEALKKIAEQKEDTVTHFSTLYNGPAHGKFGITWGDVRKLYAVIVNGEE
jgi:hypothetical protein